MMPTWMIVDLEAQRREREARERRTILQLELPEERPEPEGTPAPRGTVVVVELE